VLPLAECGRLDLVQGGETLAPGMTTLETFGHTPGHTSLVVEADGRKLVLLGDSFVHCGSRHPAAATPWTTIRSAPPPRGGGWSACWRRRTCSRSRTTSPAPGFGRVAEEDGRRLWRPLAAAPA
jgi:glyoxylase-like metal-dependent hydrolase (beta-lactamase superfamily II)